MIDSATYQEIEALAQSIDRSLPSSRYDLLIHGLRRMCGCNGHYHDSAALVMQALRLTKCFDTLSKDGGSSDLDVWERNCKYMREKGTNG